jgi:vacuolar-type H+-ATPase subunit H
MEADEAAADPDALVAHAMNRALDAERAAQAAIADCERQAAEILEHAREQRRNILERAQARIVALHTRVAGTLERQAAVITERSRQSAATAVEQLSDPVRCAKALEQLAARLTTDDAERAHDAR